MKLFRARYSLEQRNRYHPEYGWHFFSREFIGLAENADQLKELLLKDDVMEIRDLELSSIEEVDLSKPQIVMIDPES